MCIHEESFKPDQVSVLVLLLACFLFSFGPLHLPLTHTWGQFGFQPQVETKPALILLSQCLLQSISCTLLESEGSSFLPVMAVFGVGLPSILIFSSYAAIYCKSGSISIWWWLTILSSRISFTTNIWQSSGNRAANSASSTSWWFRSWYGWLANMIKYHLSFPCLPLLSSPLGKPVPPNLNEFSENRQGGGMGESFLTDSRGRDASKNGRYVSLDF